ncbi:dihydrofolate reductase [Paenarthrobacter sp. YJN-5]|uniref:dihydrofolate reductase n=1 Tax=Paenarthrobacter sp. YJN-5 TaxID=2735316 RepID=UPI001D0C899D|nr:dihydrofolate reductase [Paenarthrobacter sp. YJN-5]
MMHRHEARIGMIWAEAANGVIGRHGTMPWPLPEDFEHFRRTTEGHPVIMGRLTWESLPERFRPLPARANIVVTGDPSWSAQGAIRAGSVHYAVVAGLAQPESGPIWIIGGATVYRNALAAQLVDTAVITRIDAYVEGDTFAPDLGAGWDLATCEPSRGWAVARNGTKYRIETWVRSRQDGLSLL